MKRYLAAIGLAMGAVFGLAGSFVEAGATQNILWEVSSLGLIYGAVIVAVKNVRAGNEEIAVGFVLLAIAEAVMSGGTAAGVTGAQASFAAGTGLYIPALLFISAPSFYPMWVRAFGVLAVIPFGITSFRIFAGELVLPGSDLPGIGYGLMTIAFIGWIVKSVRS